MDFVNKYSLAIGNLFVLLFLLVGLCGVVQAEELKFKFKTPVSGPETVFVSPQKLGYSAYTDMLKRLQTKHGFYKVQNNPDVQVVNPVLGRSVYYEHTRHAGLRVVSPLQLYLDLKGTNEDLEIPREVGEEWRRELTR